MAMLLVSCATTTNTATKATAPRSHLAKVRTTAYTHNEGGSGARNAIGGRLSGTGWRSASSDWSRYPLGTKFRIVRTGEQYIIDDYGGALIGTNTIDLYKGSRAAMHNWGTRHEDIEIVQWGSKEESLKVLRQRQAIRRVRVMIASLEAKNQTVPSASTRQ